MSIVFIVLIKAMAIFYGSHNNIAQASLRYAVLKTWDKIRHKITCFSSESIGIGINNLDAKMLLIFKYLQLELQFVSVRINYWPITLLGEYISFTIVVIKTLKRSTKYTLI